MLTQKTKKLQKLIKDLFAQRKAAKEAKDDAKTDAGKKRYENLQQGIKLTMNSIYGQLGMRDFVHLIKYCKYYRKSKPDGTPDPEGQTILDFDEPNTIIDKTVVINDELCRITYRYSDNTPTNAENAPPRFMAVQLLAYAKKLMNDVIFAIDGHLYPDRVTYTDTDSLNINVKFLPLLEKILRKINGEDVPLIGDHLGGYKNDLGGDNLIMSSIQPAPKIKDLTCESSSGVLDDKLTWKGASVKKKWDKLEEKFYFMKPFDWDKIERGELEIDWALEEPLLLEEYVKVQPKSAKKMDEKGYDRGGKIIYPLDGKDPPPATPNAKMPLSKYIKQGVKKGIDINQARIYAQKKLKTSKKYNKKTKMK